MDMAKIELTTDEVQVIKEQLSGKIELFSATERQRELLTGVIRKAEALMEERNAYEEAGDDLIAWYWDLYNKQDKE